MWIHPPGTIRHMSKTLPVVFCHLVRLKRRVDRDLLYSSDLKASTSVGVSYGVQYNARAIHRGGSPLLRCLNTLA